jgi:hypothetical protein
MARLRSIRGRLHRFVRLDRQRRALLAEAAACLLLTRVALLVVPFPHLARRLGTFMAPGDVRVAHVRSTAAQDHADVASAVAWAVSRAARHVPFRAICLPQAVAARIMLSRRGIDSVLCLGVAKGRDKPLDAHAWLDAAGIEVTGYPVARDFAEIACFV